MRLLYRLAVLGLAGCKAAAGPAVVRDSAGIRIVTNGGTVWTADSSWTVDSVPSTVFGRETADSSSVLLNPVGVVRLGDGSVVVGDRGSMSVKVFGPSGVLTRVIGREGSGPGEFEYLARLMGCHGDSVFVDDIAHHVISVIGPDGAIARTFTLHSGESGSPFQYACNRQGQYVTYGWGNVRHSGPEPYRPTVPVALAGPDGKAGASLGRFPGTEMMPVRGGAGPRRMGRWLHVAMGRELAWIAPNENADLLAFTLAGALRLIVHTPTLSQPVTKADLAWYRRLVLDSTRADRTAEIGKVLDEMIPPATLPSVMALLPDSEGNLWVQRYPEPGQLQGKWEVYRADGILLGALSMPRGLFPVEIGTDYVLGLATGEDGSRWVQLHRLRRSLR